MLPYSTIVIRLHRAWSQRRDFRNRKNTNKKKKKRTGPFGRVGIWSWSPSAFGGTRDARQVPWQQNPSLAVGAPIMQPKHAPCPVLINGTWLCVQRMMGYIVFVRTVLPALGNSQVNNDHVASVFFVPSLPVVQNAPCHHCKSYSTVLARLSPWRLTCCCHNFPAAPRCLQARRTCGSFAADDDLLTAMVGLLRAPGVYETDQCTYEICKSYQQTQPIHQRSMFISPTVLTVSLRYPWSQCE